MRSVSGAAGLLCGAAAIVIGCGGGSGGAPVPLDQLVSQYAAVFCHKAFTCCDAAEIAGNNPPVPDEATCRSMLGTQINLANDEASIAAGRLVYHGDSARRCLDSLAAMACSQWGADEELTRLPDCQQLFEGIVAPGGTCELNAECAGGMCDTTAAVCVALPKLGEYCPFGLCASGLTCLSVLTTGTPTDVCGAPLGDGSNCTFGSECASAFCNLDNVTGVRTCGPPTFCNGV